MMWAAIVSVAASIYPQEVQQHQTMNHLQQQQWAQEEKPLVLDAEVAEQLPTPDALTALLALYQKDKGASTTL